MITVSTDKNLLDIPFIHHFLSTSYWAKGRTLEEVKKSIKNSLCFGIYHHEKQIGFARVLTDKVVFSYIMDVFIDKNHQGKKYGEQLMNYIYSHPDLINVENHCLITKDAQSFYKKFGFNNYSTPEKFMLKKC